MAEAITYPRRMSKLRESVQFLKGAGPRRREQLGNIGIATIGDLLAHYPREYRDRTTLTPVGALEPGQKATSLVTVKSVSVRPTRQRRQNFFATLVDDEGDEVGAVWFNQPFLQNYVRVGATLMVSGEISRFGPLQFRNPEYDEVTAGEGDLLNMGRITPMYPLTAGINQKLMRSLVAQALEVAADDVEDVLPPALVEELDLIPLVDALRTLHFPDSWDAIDRARRRVVFEEVFLYQLMLAARRLRTKHLPGTAFRCKGALSREVARSLPFELTQAQKRVLIEIRDDLRKPSPMNRLLMGEVGSGKTVVALLAGCQAIEEGFQVAVLAPTEILAAQHHRSLGTFLEGRFDVPVHLLMGKTGAKARQLVLSEAASGRPAFFVGTHALIQQSVDFAALGLVVVDEQHRFGVAQRAELKAKGAYPHNLIMTATPIPRTLSLMFHEDLDVSRLDELPRGRQPIRTKVVGEASREKVYAFIRTELHRQRRAYVVCPLVEESEAVDLRDATDTAARLQRHPAFAEFDVGLLHGRLKADEKAEVMERFRSGAAPLLVTTTVVEVGVDVPEATVMLVEHPDRYGLSQLHQLRGRIGRGTDPSHFVLVAERGLSSDALKRLRILESTSSGFEIAEADLEDPGPRRRVRHAAERDVRPEIGRFLRGRGSDPGRPTRGGADDRG